MDEIKEPRRRFTLRKLFKILLFSASALVYIVFFIRFFVSCDAKITNDLFLDRETAEKFLNLDVDYPFYHYQPEAWTNDDGSIQISNIFYIEDNGNLHLTVRTRDDRFETDRYPFEFKITVTGESEAELEPEMRTETRHGYTYARLFVNGVVSDHGEVVEVELESYDEKGNSVITKDTEIKGGTEVGLDIYDSKTGEKLYTFAVAGKNVNRARMRRSTADVVVIE